MSDLPPALAAIITSPARLGLQLGEVEVVEHDPRWAGLAEDLGTHIHQALGDVSDPVRVEHIGSTSVPGLAAKPLLDMAVGLAPGFEPSTVISTLEVAGFDFQVDLGRYGGLLFHVCAGPTTVISHVHVVSTDDFQWHWYLAFRNGLRADPELRKQYEALKRDAAAENSSNREAYTEAKFEWVLATVSALTGISPPPVS